jgi:SAM-dependent methyltransferase
VPPDPAEALVDRLFGAVVEGFDAVAAAIGDRLGYYRALDEGAGTPVELAAATGSSERYAREWLEQQAMTGLLTHADGRFALAPGAAEVLARPGGLSYFTPIMRQFTAATAQWTRIADGAASGRGLPWSGFGPEMYRAQSDGNAAALTELLAHTWLPAALPDVHARLAAGEELRVAEIGCGGGWGAIALARAFDGVQVDGYDVDEPTVGLARAQVADAGVEGRVAIHHGDVATDLPETRYDLVTAFECLHDMPDPVGVLTGVRRMLAPGGKVMVADMAGAEEFTPDGDPLQRLLYGFSVLICLPDAMSGNPEDATGTVMRPATMDRYARAAGFTAAVPLDIEHDMWRFYELTT